MRLALVRSLAGLLVCSIAVAGREDVHLIAPLFEERSGGVGGGGFVGTRRGIEGPAWMRGLYWCFAVRFEGACRFGVCSPPPGVLRHWFVAWASLSSLSERFRYTVSVCSMWKHLAVPLSQARGCEVHSVPHCLPKYTMLMPGMAPDVLSALLKLCHALKLRGRLVCLGVCNHLGLDI